MSVVFLFLLHLFFHEPPLVIARDTTYITAPLRRDGTPDYEKYVLNISRKGATPENNAAVLFWQALWPNSLEPNQYEAMRTELGWKQLPAPNSTLQVLSNDATYKQLSDWLRSQHLGSDKFDPDDIVAEVDKRAWTRSEFPPLADWVDRNQRPLDLLVEASRRPRFYSPSPTLLDKKHDLLISMLLPGAQNMRYAVCALGVRAMRHVGEHRLDNAWSDLLAVHRLSRLMAQEPTVIEQLVAMACDGIACNGTLMLLSDEHLTAKQSREIQRDLVAMPYVADVRRALNDSERLMVLDGMVYTKLYGPESLGNHDTFLAFAGRAMPVDWNVALRHVNKWFDRLDAISRMDSREKRKLAVAEFDRDLDDEAKRADDLHQRLQAIFSTRRRSEWIGAVFACLMMPALDSALDAEDRTNTMLELTRVAAALAIYHAERGKYPASLDELIPSLLKKWPVDQFDSRQLIYKRTDAGYLLYSTGSNGIDDGGSNAKLELVAGRTFDEINHFDSRKPKPKVPESADDISICMPRPPFELPKVRAASDNQSP